MMRSPGSAARSLLLALIAAISFLNYWEYSRAFYTSPDIFLDIVRGDASAPAQYRVLIVRAAWFLHQHAQVGMRHAFALFDLVCAAIATLVLLRLLERSFVFRRAAPLARWLAYAIFLFLTAYYLLWITWYQRPETLPTTCLVALMFATMCRRPGGTASLVLIVMVTAALTVLQALTRADVAFSVYGGLFLYALTPRGRQLPAGRAFNATLGAGAAILAVAVQWWMMHRVYPHATYGNTPVFQLVRNFQDPTNLFSFAVFMFPVACTLWIVAKRRLHLEPAWMALLTGSLLFLPLWLVLGIVGEVRIFLPFTVALIPISVAAVLSVAPAGSPSADPSLRGVIYSGAPGSEE